MALLPELGGEQGKARIFYDAWHESKVIGYNSNRKLQKVYSKDSDLIVPFYCKDYLEKKWCGVELRAIEELLFDQEYERVLPFRFDMVDIPGSFKTDVFPIITERSPEDIARLILERYMELHGDEVVQTTSPHATPAHAIPADISRITEYAPTQLIGREAETQLLHDAWAKAQNNETKRPHLLTFVALGGEGKTSLVAKWAAELAHLDWPGCDAVFAWSFYSQGSEGQVAPSSEFFLKEALTFFGDSVMADSAVGAFDKGRRLAELVGGRQALLILDGLEPLQYAPTSPTPGELKDPGLAALLKGLATKNYGLCVVTTRYSIPNLRAFWQNTAQEKNILRLSKEAGVALLRVLGVKGQQLEFETLVEDVKGHALTLNLLGAYLRDAHAGDIRKRDLINLREADEEQGGHAFRVMDAYVRWFESDRSEGKKSQRALALLRLLGLFDRPADAGCLIALWKAPLIPNLTEPLVAISEAHRNQAFTRLQDAKLVTIKRDGSGVLLTLDAHPLLRAYFALQLRTYHPEAWRVAHERLYKYLCTTTEDKPEPTLEDLQPLYQAVSHGCQAEMQQEACEMYRNRIIRESASYSTRRLGALGSNLGALACFFEQQWSRVSPVLTENAKGWLMSEAAHHLVFLGRLTEAMEPVQVALEVSIARQAWKNAAITVINLNHLERALGKVAKAVKTAELSVDYADRSTDATTLAIGFSAYAEALHQAGREAEAAAQFLKAEAIWIRLQPENPLLHSSAGFHYCDLLLAGAERAAWRGMFNSSFVPQPSLSESCREVSKHAAQTLLWSEQNAFSLLDIAHDRLTLGRTALYMTILDSDMPQQSNFCRDSLDQAIEGFRRAQVQYALVEGLLSRAWLRFLAGAPSGAESSQSDLDEAWEIVERGPMPLFMADIHLHRARLFGLSKDRPATYPWTSLQHDLTEARRLIEKHGYERRKEELEDAEAAARR